MASTGAGHVRGIITFLTLTSNNVSLTLLLQTMHGINPSLFMFGVH